MATVTNAWPKKVQLTPACKQASVCPTQLGDNHVGTYVTPDAMPMKVETAANYGWLLGESAEKRPQRDAPDMAGWWTTGTSLKKNAKASWTSLSSSSRTASPSDLARNDTTAGTGCESDRSDETTQGRRLEPMMTMSRAVIVQIPRACDENMFERELFDGGFAQGRDFFHPPIYIDCTARVCIIDFFDVAIARAFLAAFDERPLRFGVGLFHVASVVIKSDSRGP